MILDGSNKSLRQALNILDVFERISGLKVNDDKTNVVYIGSLCNKAPNPNVTDKKLNWVSDGKFTTLGVHFSTTLEEMVSINYDKVMISVKNTIQHWSKRNLTVLGRVTDC